MIFPVSEIMSNLTYFIFIPILLVPFKVLLLLTFVNLTLINFIQFMSLSFTYTYNKAASPLMLLIFHLVSSFFSLLADILLSLLIIGSFMHLFIKYTYTEESKQPGQEI